MGTRKTTAQKKSGDGKRVARGLSEEQKSELLAEAEKKRYERRRQERERFEATADRLSDELRSLPSGVEKTAYHEAKGIEPLPGVPVRNGDLLVPGYDVEGKLWTIQYIKEDGTKRFARESRKHGCFHVVGAANSIDGLLRTIVRQSSTPTPSRYDPYIDLTNANLENILQGLAD